MIYTSKGFSRLFLSTILCIILLAGCGDKDETPTPGSTAAVNELSEDVIIPDVVPHELGGETIAPFLTFPLSNRNPGTASINSIFDHSMRVPYVPDDEVRAYTGEKATKRIGGNDDLSCGQVFINKDGFPLFGFKNSDGSGSAFKINGHYEGDNQPDCLWYDGHPGYDYRTRNEPALVVPGVPNQDATLGRVAVLAAADGVAFHLQFICCNAIGIDHGNGYITRYLHLDTRLVPDNHPVKRGDVIGISGDKGSRGGPHLHFEVRRKIIKDGVEIKVPVDPYGWRDPNPGSLDPYPIPNVNLWMEESPSAISGFNPKTFNFNAIQGGSNPPSQTISIINTGGGTLTWSGDVSLTNCGSALPISWLNVLNPAMGTAPSSAIVSVDATGCDVGTFNGTITLTALGATNSPQTIPVSLTVTAPPLSFPAIGVTPASLSFSGEQGGTNPPNQILNITNLGGGTLNWNAAENVSWLDVSPLNGTAPSSISVSPNIVGLLAGTYNGAITISASGATNTPQIIPVSLTVTPPPIGGVTTLATTGMSVSPQRLTIDSTHVYWTEYGGSAGGNVKKVLKAGGTVMILASGLTNPSGLSSLVDIASDGSNAYFNDIGTNALGAGQIMKVPLTGGIVTTLTSNLNSPRGIAVDTTSVYWADEGSVSIKKVPIGGGTVVTLASGLIQPRDIAIDNTNVYWVEDGGSAVKKVPKSGGALTILASGLSCTPGKIALDSSFVYWGDSAFGPSCGVKKVPINGGVVSVLASNLSGSVWDIVVDSSFVYFVEGGSLIKKIPLTGGIPTALITGLDSIFDLALDITNIYWIENGDTTRRVAKMPK